MLVLKLFFRDESNLYGDYLSFILTINCKCFTFQFLTRGIRAYIYIITLIQKGHISGYKHGHILLKNVLLKLHFQYEGHVDVLLSYYLLYSSSFSIP